MPYYTVRKMEESDWDAVSRIYEQGINSNLATLTLSCPSFEEWDATHLNQCRLVITENDEVIGWAALMPFSARSAYSGVVESSIYIDRSKRHRGAGRTLLQSLISLTEQEDIWSIQAIILRENHPSIRLHESCGFRVIGYRERLGRDRFGAWRDMIIMERRSPKD